jgi:hypothetical protein
MSLEFAKTAPGVMVASWTHPKSGRVKSVAIIKSCDAWNTFIDGEWIARDLSSFEDAVAAAERKLTPRASSNMIRVAGVCLLAVILGASAVVASKFMPAVSTAKVTPDTEEGKGGGAQVSKYSSKVETVAPDKPVRDLAVSEQPLPVRRDGPTLRPRAHHF